MTGELFLNHSITKLTQMTAHIETCLSKLDSGQIWNRPHETQNSIGNLVLHLAGNVRQWIGSSIDGQPDIRQREREFALNSKMEPSELLATLHLTVSHAVLILKNLPPHRLTDLVSTQDGQRSVLEVIYQVVGHFQQHTGQIIFETKRLTGEDLKFYTPPKKSS
ncbi:MAG: DUF1572 family protein [Bryobacteraceae bacterium]